ncbi:MAG: PilZ domain-containing protein [Phycisphaeraceae bacterium]|nr:PilZ domain-containing protein [Phycisphaeraceae bacterium]
MSPVANRRRHQRYVLQPMYTPVAVRLLDREQFDIEGHAYDISVGGMRFELDERVAPGTTVAIQITLPMTDETEVGPGRSIYVLATIVWIEDDDVPGPVRTAAVFNHFARVGDQERLARQFSTGRFRLAA